MSDRGHHQNHLPRSFMVAGDITRVIRVASIRRDTHSPKPNSATMTIWEMEKAKKTTSITAAAPMTTRPVRRKAYMMASDMFPVSS